MLKKLLPLMGLLILAALFFTILVLGGDNDNTPAPVAPEPIGTVKSSDVAALSQAFGLDVPYGSGRGSGEVRDVSLGSLNARLFTWQGEDGLIAQAVRPAEAAQLLRREGLQLDESTLWTLGDKTLLIAEGQDGACAYYQDDEAAYSLYRAGADTQELLAALANAHFPD